MKRKAFVTSLISFLIFAVTVFGATSPVSAKVLASPIASSAHQANKIKPNDNWWQCGPGNGSAACDGQDPIATGCNQDGVAIANQYVNFANDPGTHLAYVQLFWSQACGTNWVRITAIYSLTKMYATIWDYHYGSPSSNTYIYDNGGYPAVYPTQLAYSNMIYAPNNSVTICGYASFDSYPSTWSSCGYY